MAETEKVVSVTFNEVQQRVMNIVIDRLARKQGGTVSLDANLKQAMDADSLDLIEIVIEIEDEFSINFPAEIGDLEEQATIRKLALAAWDLIQAKNKAKEAQDVGSQQTTG